LVGASGPTDEVKQRGCVLHGTQPRADFGHHKTCHRCQQVSIWEP
jgi:hypothetical protein